MDKDLQRTHNAESIVTCTHTHIRIQLPAGTLNKHF